MRSNRQHMQYLLLALLFAMMPHWFRLPAWVIFWSLGFWGYVLFTVRVKSALLSPKLRPILTLAGILLVVIGSGRLVNRDTAVALLAVMAALKPLEIRSYRDKMIVIFLAYFLVLSNLIYDNSLPMALYMFLSVFLTTAVLINLNHQHGKLPMHLKLSARIILQAFPLMIILFFLFPRIHGNLWGFAGKTVGKSGFTEHLELGDVIDIVQDDKVAFRVEFKGKIPKPSRLYWRGIVFWHFDGKSWRREPSIPSRQNPITGANPIAYTVTLEPHYKRWLFALDLPISTTGRVNIRDDHTIRSRRRVRQRITYNAESYTVYETGEMKPWDINALSITDRGNPKTVALALKWVEQTNSPKEIVQKAIGFFRQSRFTYTLNPPVVHDDIIDDFLFESRKGYCEHFASAFALLMRAAQIPARIVGGYLGGERNPFGNYIIVRQSDAHAWVEVWLPKKGWVRVDPTAVVAPARVEHGMSAAIPSNERPAFLSWPYMSSLFQTWKQIRLGWDAVSSYWNRWFMSYSNKRQQKLLFQLGIGAASLKGITKGVILIFGALGIGIAFAFLFWGQLKLTGKPKDKVQDLYDRFCLKLSRKGIHRMPHQGPADFAKRIAIKKSDLEMPVKNITELYVRLRYSRNGGVEDLKRLASLVKEFNPS